MAKHESRPDISKLIRDWADLKEVGEKAANVRVVLELLIHDTYKKAGVTPKDCDHPTPLRGTKSDETYSCGYCKATVRYDDNHLLGDSRW